MGIIREFLYSFKRPEGIEAGPDSYFTTGVAHYAAGAAVYQIMLYLEPYIEALIGFDISIIFVCLVFLLIYFVLWEIPQKGAIADSVVDTILISLGFFSLESYGEILAIIAATLATLSAMWGRNKNV